MSRIAFFCIPAWGHTNPTVEVVRELTKQGHTVRYYSFEEFRDKLESAGAEVVACDAFLPPQPADLERRVGKDFASLVEMVVDTTLALEETVCRELADFQPDGIVSDSVCFWGKLFAKRLGVPYICSTTPFAFNQQTSKLMKPKAGEMVRSILGMPKVNRKMALLRQHGYPVEKLTDLLQNDNETSTIVYTSKEFQPMAETFSDQYAFVGPSVPAVTAAQREKKRPLVYISLGTVMNRNPAFYRNCFAALGDMDVDVVLSTGGDVKWNAPANFTVEKRVDQLAVLAEADAFLTHCGMNSANEAIWFGVPTILFPQQSEEAAVAARMEELNLGVRLKRDTPEAIRTAVQQVLADGQYRKNTQQIAQSFRVSGGAKRAAAYILDVCER